MTVEVPQWLQDIAEYAAWCDLLGADRVKLTDLRAASR